MTKSNIKTTPVYKGEKIDFDRIEVQDIPTDFSKLIVWYKGKNIVNKIRLSDESMALYPLCPACLKWYGKKTQMTKKKTLFIKNEAYTFSQCPDCKGLNTGDCICGETPHRIKCPMGFYLYFNLL